jgi:hypothetical protein
VETPDSQASDRVPVRVRVSLTFASLCLIALVATAPQASGVTTDGFSLNAVARDRTTRDMPDDAGGRQVHFLYVVPSEGIDRQLDRNGGMDQSIARIEGWLATQTGNQGLRIDTRSGVPDITFMRLPRSDTQTAAHAYHPLLAIGEDLVAAGFNDPSKVYAFFYAGHGTLTCGGATSLGPVKLSAMFLLGGSNEPEAQVCRDVPGYGPGTNRAGFFEIALLHEIMHAIGFSPRCAPPPARANFRTMSMTARMTSCGAQTRRTPAFGTGRAPSSTSTTMTTIGPTSQGVTTSRKAHTLSGSRPST